MSTCHLCDLPTPETPVTAPDVEGAFCCRGCLEVSRALAEGNTDVPDGIAPDTPRDQEAEADSGSVPDDAAETYLSVAGMHCTTCEAFLSLRGRETDGVYDVDGNYGMETARVRFDPDELDESDLPERLSGYGYQFRSPSESTAGDRRERQRDTIQRLVVGGFLMMLVMPWYFFYLYPSYLGFETGIVYADTTTAVGLYLPMTLIGLLSAGVVGYTGAPVLRGAWISVRTRQPNMDLLIAVAALSAYAYSTVALAFGRTHIYYDVSVVVIMVVTLGRYYEGQLRSAATERLSKVTAAREQEATRLTDEGRETVSVETLEPDDRVVVAPGERVPVDGTVLEGIAAVDESVLTGESLPVTKEPGDSAVGGSVVTDDALVIAVDSPVRSTVDRIATVLWDIQSRTPGVQRLVDALATVFVPLVLVLGVVVAGWQLLTGASVATALLAGLVVLIVSCPCAMGLATPLAISAGLRDGLDEGVVVANESVFEVAPEADVVVFDKTGTLTEGEMAVTDVVGDDETLRLAAAVERYASHPVADAVLDAAVDSSDSGTASPDPMADGGETATTEPESDDVGETVDTEQFTDAVTRAVPTASEFTRYPGDGVAGVVDGRHVVVGTPDLVEREVGSIPDDISEAITAVEADGHLPVVVGWSGQAKGVVAVGDSERAAWSETLDAFADSEVVVLTGDEGADQFRAHAAVDTVFAGVPPDGKVETVRRLSARGTTVMVGDGTNDAPALAAADLGIAMGEGTAQAIDAADAVILDEDLAAVETVFSLARGTRRRIRENICWALGYNAVALPLAIAGVLNPLFAALAMAASSIIVVSNSRRSVTD